MRWISHKYRYIPSLLSTPHPSPPGHHSTQLSSPLAVCFTQGSGCTSMLLSQFTSPSPSPAVSTRPFSTSASSFLPCKQETVFCLKTGRLRQKQRHTSTALQLGTWLLLVNAGYQRWNRVPCLLGWTSKSVDGGWLEPVRPLSARECLKKQGNQARMKPAVLHGSWWHCCGLSWARDRCGWMHSELILDLCVSKLLFFFLFFFFCFSVSSFYFHCF